MSSTHPPPYAYFVFVRPNVRAAQLLANPSAETRIHFVIVLTTAV